MSDTQFNSALNDPFDVANADNLHQPGFAGVSPDVWRSLANFGGNLASAANARTAGGFLANGPGFAGPFGAAISQSQAQGLNRGQALSDINYRNSLAQNQQLQNLVGRMNLPLQMMQNQMQMRMMTDPQFRQQMMAQFGLGGPGPLASGTDTGGASNGAAGGATTATGDTPQGGSPFSRGIIQMESGGYANAKNPLSQAAGPAQFIPDTWNQFAKENPQYFQGKSPEEILAMRTDPQLSATATDWYAAKNAAQLKSAGLDATPQNLGIAHAFGAAGATGILKFPDDASLSQVLSVTQPGQVDEILRENPQYGRMTVGDLKAKYVKIGAPSWMAQSGQGGAESAQAQSAPQVAQGGAATGGGYVLPTQPYQVAQAGSGPIPVPSGQGSVASPQQSLAPWARPQAQAGAPQSSAQPQPQPQPQGSQSAPQMSDAQRQGAALMAQATQYEQQANQLEQQRSLVAAQNVQRANFAKMFPGMAPFMTPLPMPVGDPAALRTAAQQFRQTALELQSAGPEASSKAQNSNVDVRPGGMVRIQTPQGPQWVKNPMLEKVQNPDGSESWVHVTPPLPGSPPGTAGESTPVLGAGGQPSLASISPQQEDFLKGRGKSLSDQFDAIDEAAAAAKDSNYLFDNMRLDSQTWDMNKFADFEGDARAWLKAVSQTFGIPTPQLDQKIADFTAFSKSSGMLLRAAVHETSSRAAVQEYTMIGKTLPSPTSTKEAFEQIAAQWQGLNDFRLAKQQFARSYTGNPQDFNVDFNSSVSPTSFMLNRLSQTPEGQQTMKGMLNRLQQTPEGRLAATRMLQQYQYAKSHSLFSDLPPITNEPAPQAVPAAPVMTIPPG